MDSELMGPQRALAQFMSSISEDAWRAGWMDGLEFALWECVLGKRTRYGMAELIPDQIEQLRQLSAACGGWIVFEDERGATWLPLDEWRARFERVQQRGDSFLRDVPDPSDPG